ncbi:hypothetical protein FRC00_003192 [Tulasnella sp. 408]|nr:hypothetical protein FRC00_003192 [Tulasnella sp. 408]
MTSAPQTSTAARQVNPTEVGWQFVPQYYTFVNKQPNRLHCFYTKNSTFSHGTEGEDTKACFGQQEIHSKIMALNYENCKVFIHSVDAQSSANSGILIQVVGEMSNRDEPWKKFVQTFFLAEQPNGYFVLNDIFRFLKEESADEGEEEEEQEAAVEEEQPSSTQASVEQSQEPAAPVPVSVSVPVDQVASFTPEDTAQPTSASPAPPAAAEAIPAPEAAASQSTEAPYINGVNGHSEAVESEETQEAEPAPPAPEAEAEPVTTIAEPTPAPEVPPPVKVPSPAPPASSAVPAASNETPQKSPAPTPAPPPPAPSGPKTWATLAASNNKKWGSVASDAKGVSAAAPQTPPPAPSPRPTPNGTRAQEQASPQAITTAQCFVKGVTENVSEQAMRDILTSRFGPIKELEIVRNKACAFLEFTTIDAARKAIQASLPTHAGGEGGIRLEAKPGTTGAPPRLTVERRKERDERPPPRPRGGAPAFGEGRGAIGMQPGEGRGPQSGRGRGAARGRGGAPKS